MTKLSGETRFGNSRWSISKESDPRSAGAGGDRVAEQGSLLETGRNRCG